MSSGIPGQPCPPPALTTSFVATPPALSFSIIASDCCKGTRRSASPWMISVGGSSGVTWEIGETSRVIARRRAGSVIGIQSMLALSSSR